MSDTKDLENKDPETKEPEHASPVVPLLFVVGPILLLALYAALTN